MVETALVMSFLIFMLFSSIDLYFLSSAYSTYSQIAREGVLTGIRMGSLFNPTACSGSEPGVIQSNLHALDSAYSNCKNGDTPLITCGHYLVQWRLKKALDAFKSSRVTSSNVTTRCMTLPRKAIEVQLEGSFTGFSPIFKNLTIRVRQRGEVI